MKRVPLFVAAAAFLLCLCTTSVLSQEQDDVFTKFDKSPIPVRTPPPQVPNDLKGQAGIVSIILIIDENVDVATATVSKSTAAGFEQPSIEAVKKWKFKPAEVGGQAVRAKVTIPIHFTAAK
jgi:periplasmic protein TonB